MLDCCQSGSCITIAKQMAQEERYDGKIGSCYDFSEKQTELHLGIYAACEENEYAYCNGQGFGGVYTRTFCFEGFNLR